MFQRRPGCGEREICDLSRWNCSTRGPHLALRRKASCSSRARSVSRSRDTGARAGLGDGFVRFMAVVSRRRLQHACSASLKCMTWSAISAGRGRPNRANRVRSTRWTPQPFKVLRGRPYQVGVNILPRGYRVCVSMVLQCPLLLCPVNHSKSIDT